MSGAFKEFQEYVRQLEMERGFAGESVLQKCLLLGEEVGERFQAIRKTAGMRIDASTARAANPAHEMADILIVLATIANRLDIDLDEAIRAKEAMNKARTWTGVE